eukprot:s474_g10.t1
MEEGIIWDNVSVSVNGKMLVQPHSGSAKACRLLAVMGPSGAGKSLLLHSLCGLAPSNATVLGSVYGAGKVATEVGVPQRNMALLEQCLAEMARRVAFVLEGSRGDVQPYLVAALALKRANYKVLMLGPEDVADMMTYFNLDFTVFYPVNSRRMAKRDDFVQTLVDNDAWQC